MYSLFVRLSSPNSRLREALFSFDSSSTVASLQAFNKSLEVLERREIARLALFISEDCRLAFFISDDCRLALFIYNIGRFSIFLPFFFDLVSRLLLSD